MKCIICHVCLDAVILESAIPHFADVDRCFHCTRVIHLLLLDVECGSFLPGEGDVASRHFLQVIDRGRLTGEAVVWVIVGHDGGGTQLTELAVWTLQLQLDRLQLCVFTSVHWRDEINTFFKKSFIPPQRYIHNFKKTNKTLNPYCCRILSLRAKPHKVESFYSYYFSKDLLLVQQQFL